MTECHQCGKNFSELNIIQSGRKKLCDDCYIELETSKVKKHYYENSKSEFMQRLKSFYIGKPQQYH